MRVIVVAGNTYSVKVPYLKARMPILLRTRTTSIVEYIKATYDCDYDESLFLKDLPLLICGYNRHQGVMVNYGYNFTPKYGFEKLENLDDDAKEEGFMISDCREWVENIIDDDNNKDLLYQRIEHDQSYGFVNSMDPRRSLDESRKHEEAGVRFEIRNIQSTLGKSVSEGITIDELAIEALELVHLSNVLNEPKLQNPIPSYHSFLATAGLDNADGRTCPSAEKWHKMVPLARATMIEYRKQQAEAISAYLFRDSKGAGVDLPECERYVRGYPPEGDFFLSEDC